MKYRPRSTRKYVPNAVQKDKVDSLLGFAVKAGKLLYGSDTLETARKAVYLIVMCGTTAENTRKKVLELAAKKNIPVLEAQNALQDTVTRCNCKVIAITDRQMANAMQEYAGQNYRLIRSEVK